MLAEDSMKRLCGKLSNLTSGDQMFPFPKWDNEVFSELYDECKKIDKRVTRLKNSVVAFNEDANNNTQLSYDIKKLSEQSRKKYDDEVEKIEKSIFKLTDYIVWTLKQD